MKQIMKQALFFELAQIPDDVELNKKYKLSEMFYRRMHHLVDRMERRKFMVKCVKYISAAASIIILLFTLSHPTYLAQAKNEIIRWFETHVALHYSEDSKETRVPEYRLGYVPEGYILETEDYYENSGIIVYTNGEHQIDLFYGTSDTMLNINNEQAEYYRLKGLNGEIIEYFKSTNPNRESTLTWLSSDENVVFSIGGVLDKEELLEIKDHIQKK